MVKITIITNTIRRPIELVEKSLRSSLDQDGMTNLILVDQNLTPLTFSQDISSNNRFFHIKAVVPSVSEARNLAPYPADTEWLVFCDDDGYLDAKYLQALKVLFIEFPSVEIFAGAIKRIDNGEYYSKRHAMGGDMGFFINTKLLMGSNFVIKSKVFERLGKFDERFGAGAVYGSSEETDLAWNAFFNGIKMRYSPELVVFHIPPFALDANNDIAKAFRYGFGKGALVKKWLKMGKWIVLLELIEMCIVPILQAPIFLVFLRMKQFRIQVASLQGRIKGLKGHAA